ncbi:sphingomyelin phosphodiesterase [Anaeramoeba flamelloides]|uniref:Sphingomyelin phosphodiesterase n=1 Tax=Anaeramoeba flamelloides TaxID=1746091 RepID=A0AAV8ADQ4_9EUKA|nr:sphingomyelin phosphodiesterase [Anaeramoeba flamelloides]
MEQKLRILALSFFLLFVLPINTRNIGKFLVMNDIHVDQKYRVGSMADCEYPASCCCRDEPTPDYKGALAEKWGSKDCQTTNITFEAGIKSAAAQENIDFMLLIGDYPSMDVWRQTKEYNVGVDTYVIDTIKKHIKVPVIPAIGNHDLYPANEFDCSGNTTWFYDKMSELYGEWLPKDKTTFKFCGWYSHTIFPTLKFIILNDMLCDPYNFYEYDVNHFPKQQLDWLKSELEDSRNKKQKVYIVTHIPLGPDTTEIWPPVCWYDYSMLYANVWTNYSDIIASGFSGHTHTDEFRIVYDSKTGEIGKGMFLISPSFSNENNRYSGYRIYEYDKDTWEIINYYQWYANIEKSNKDDTEPKWELYYDFLSTYNPYGINDLSSDSLATLTNNLGSDTSLYKTFATLYSPLHDIYKDKRKAELICGLSIKTEAQHLDCIKKY